MNSCRTRPTSRSSDKPTVTNYSIVYQRPGSADLPAQQLERDWPPTPGAPRLTNPQPAPAANADANADAGSSSNPETSRKNMARLLAEWARGGALGQPEDGK